MSVIQLFFAYISDLVSPYAWSIIRAVWPSTGSSGIFSVAAQETSASGVFFKPDGTKMYVLGTSGGDVNEYNLATPWDVTTASFVQSQFQGYPSESTPTGIFFKPDGLTMYLIGQSNDFVAQYTLTTAWDISTFSFTERFSINAQEGSSESVFFSTDGTKMYVIGNGGDDVNEYTLYTAWSVSTASYTRVFSVVAQEAIPRALFFKPDGTKMYVSGNSEKIHEYTLTTPWNLSSASFTRSTIDIGEFRSSINVGCIFIKPDGTELYVANDLTDDIITFTMLTPWDVSSLVIKRPTYSASTQPQFTSAHDLFFHPDGTKVFILGQSLSFVVCYDLLEPWRIQTIRYVNEFNVGTQESSPTGLFFRPDGLKMYVIGTNNDRVQEYNLSTAWNVTTAVFSHNFSVGAQDPTPDGLFFTPDGLTMYVVGNRVYQFVLTTAWNISTASYVREYNTNLQDTSHNAIYFKPDGSRMYTVGNNNAAVYEYLLTTPWNVGTASYVQNFSVTAQQTNPRGISFKPDGTTMYIVGGGSVHEYVIQ